MSLWLKVSAVVVVAPCKMVKSKVVPFQAMKSFKEGSILDAVIPHVGSR